MKQRAAKALTTLLTTSAWAKRIAALVVLMGAAAVWYIQQNPSPTSRDEGRIIQGTIVGVADGDTATLRTVGNQSIRIRFAFIDAPEKHQPYGQAAKKNLSDLIYHQAVTLHVQDIDQYGRTVGRVCIGDKDINLAQIQSGYAWHYKRYAKKVQSREAFALYAQAQVEAKQRHLGLWQQANPTPPWVFRQATKNKR